MQQCAFVSPSILPLKIFSSSGQTPEAHSGVYTHLQSDRYNVFPPRKSDRNIQEPDSVWRGEKEGEREGWRGHQLSSQSLLHRVGIQSITRNIPKTIIKVEEYPVSFLTTAHISKMALFLMLYSKEECHVKPVTPVIFVIGN